MAPDDPSLDASPPPDASSPKDRDPRALAREASERARAGSTERLDRKTLFYMVSRSSFREGVLDERANLLLNRLRSFLRLDKRVAREIGKLARHESKRGLPGPGPALSHRELYRRVCERALADAVLDAHEREMLEGLADLLELGEGEAAELLSRAEGGSGGDRGAAPEAEEDEEAQGEEGDEGDPAPEEEVAGKSAEQIALERRHSLAADAEGLLDDWRSVSGEEAEAGPPPTFVQKLGGGLGIFCLTLTWASMVVLTLLFVTPTEEVRGVVERRRVVVEPGPGGERRSVEFWVGGRRYMSAVPGLVRWVRPGDQLLLRVRRVAGRGLYLQEVRQLRESPRGYRYQDHGFWIALGLSTSFVLAGLLGFGLAVRRRPGVR